jgi:ABC-type branched-subunit amino acid transport system substrate-binding protein
MTRRTALIAGGLLLSALCVRTAALHEGSSDASPGLEQRGKEIYLGTATASAVKARIGVPPVDAPATLLACVNCHGRDGTGKPEGSVVPSDITWEALTKPYGVTHASGRTHRPYTERLLVRAICLGIDPAGHELHPTMPRFQMSREDADALIGYLKRLGHDAEPGLSESAIAIGAVVTAGTLSAALLHAYFDALNAQGGIYGRRVELAQTTLDGLSTARPPFAIVGGGIARAEQAIVAAAERQQIPFVGSQTIGPAAGATTSATTFALLSGVEQQTRALVDYGRRSGWSDVRTIDLTREIRTARALAEALQASSAEHVLLIGGGRQMLDFANAAAGIGWTPVLLIPGSLATDEVLAMPSPFAGRVFLAMPSMPSDQTSAGSAAYRALADTYHLRGDEMASQLAALCSAKVLTQGLKLAGRSLTRAKLVAALEGLTDFDTGLMPRIGFGPNRRIGAPGAYIVAVDLAGRRFTRVSDWMSVDVE